MPSKLIVCPSCATHVLAEEATCPHCDAAIPSGGVVTRTAGALLMGLALAGCPAEDTDKNETTAVYGVPTTESDSATSSSSTGDDSSSSGASSSTGETDTDTDGSTSLSPDYGVPTTSGD